MMHTETMFGEKTLNRVLIADDNTFIRFLVKKWLEAEAQIFEVAHGKDVLDAVKQHAPHVIFLDIHLPGRSGKDILKDILAYRRDSYVVMLSADSMKENVLFAADNGAKAFITKPFTRETLHRYFTMCPTIAMRKDGPESELEVRGAVAAKVSAPVGEMSPA